MFYAAGDPVERFGDPIEVSGLDLGMRNELTKRAHDALAALQERRIIIGNLYAYVIDSREPETLTRTSDGNSSALQSADEL